MKKADRTILLNPGPVNVSERVRSALARPDMCHRESEFADLLISIRSQLVELFSPNSKHIAAIINGSGTAALEAAISSMILENEKLLIFDNGVYGDRMAKIAHSHNIETVVIQSSWGQPPSLHDACQAFEVDASIGVIAAVHHETTLGFINPVDDICELAREFGKKVIIDSVSGLGGEDIDLARVDVVVSTANKCIQGLPGASFVMLKNDMLHRLEAAPKRSLYFDLANTLEYQGRNETPFTPAIPAMYAFDEALKELKEETLEGRIKRYAGAAWLLRDGFEKLGLKAAIEEPYMSNTITSLEVPPAISYDILHDEMKRRNFVIYAGQGNFSGKIFRVANMGDIHLHEFKLFLEVLEEVLTGGG